MTVKDITRARKTYSYYRSVPDIISSDSSNNTTVVYSDFKGFIDGGFSPVSRASNGTYVTTLAAGSRNAGRQFFYDDFAVASNVSFSGIRFWWPGGGGAKTVRCRLYVDDGNTLVDSVDVSVNASGIYSGTFATPTPLSQDNAYKLFVAAMWETTGTYYVHVTGYSANAYPEPLATVIPASRGLYLNNWRQAAGNNDPTSGGSDPYPIEPTFIPTVSL